MSVFFGGRLLITPTVESVVDDSQMLNRNLTVGNSIALMGRSEGGKPKTPLILRSPSHARQTLRDGELLKAVEKAFAPSADTRGPSRVIAMRVNPAVQASLTLQDAGANNVITLTSSDYGLYTNQIKVKVEAGTDKGKKLTSQIGDDFFTKDNVARDAFTVQYTGAEATGVMTITETTVTLEAPTATVIATIDLNTYKTVQQLVDRINAETGWAATVTPGSGTTAALKGLDGITDQDVKTALYTVTANLQAIIDWFTSTGEGYLDAVRVGGALAVPVNIPFTYLTGGSDGTTTNTDWQEAFDALQTEDVQWVVPLSSDTSIWAMADTHVAFMSGVGKQERRAFVGGATGLTVANATAHAALLNSDRTAYVYPGIYDFNAAGELTLYPPYMAAAIVGAGFAGLSPGETMTNKSLRVAGVELDLAVPADTDTLIPSGVLAIHKTHRGIRVAKGVSTWLNDSKFNRVEISTGAAVDFVLRNVREALQVFVGKKSSPLSLQEAVSRTGTVLRNLSIPDPAGPGVLVGDTDNPPFRDIRAEIEGDVLRVEFECSPVIPINYVLITVHAVPFNSI